jgi:putative nucleotidyltransferase-like protein
MDELALSRIAAIGLDETSTDPPIRTSAQEWPAFLGAIVRHRLSGLAVAAAELGVLTLEANKREELLARHRESMLCALALERNLLALASAFEEAAIEFVVLKGPAVARTAYPDASWRPFGDIDVLVGAKRFGAACEVLADLGYRRRFVEPRPGFAARFGKGAAHVGPDGLEIDLHRLLAEGPFGYWVDHDTILGTTATFELAGRPLARLDDTAILLHACMHAVLGGRSPTLLQLRDVAQLSRRRGVGWGALAAWGKRWRLQAVLGRALDLVEHGLGLPLPDEARALRRSLRPSRQEERALRACVSSGRLRGARAMASLGALPGVRSKAAYAGALVFPRREFLEARTGASGIAGYLRRWRVPLGWLAARPR